MHKKLEADLISLAHSILQMKNKDNVFLLKQKSKEIYEKLSVLAFVEEYVNSTPGLKVTKEELLGKVAVAFELKENTNLDENTAKETKEIEEKVVFNLVDDIEEVKQEVDIEEKVAPKTFEILEQPFDELEEIMFSETIVEETNAEEIKVEAAIVEEYIVEVAEIEEPIAEIEEPIVEVINVEEVIAEVPTVDDLLLEKQYFNDVVKVEVNKTKTLEEELQDTFSVDLMADLFENAQPKSLNDRFAANIQIGLNDRIVFVKNLFNNQHEDYNRVISQLNSFKSVHEAKDFILKMVKPDYNWAKHEELEARFLEIIERKFS
ncbi:hypothetical protein [uncultured Polaribacter sp.]|uniref:hypothetical protein n=1 Tax=uncultured Polaribacter sp. TaxID=174711 RepID=UPI0030DCF5E8|tara:strand:- start:1521 stop:2480 length:960 start_codon:yes stop_codon:yes gene_type:complete